MNKLVGSGGGLSGSRWANTERDNVTDIAISGLCLSQVWESSCSGELLVSAFSTAQANRRLQPRLDGPAHNGAARKKVAEKTAIDQDRSPALTLPKSKANHLTNQTVVIVWSVKFKRIETQTHY